MIDLTTLYIMVAFGGIIAGLIHIVPWTTGWFGRWAAWWGFGHIVLGISALGAVMRDMGAPDWLVLLGNPLGVMAYAAIYCGMRSFCGMPSRAVAVMSLAVIIALPLMFSVDRAAFPMRVAYLSVVRTLFDLGTVVLAVGLARNERLHTAWIVTVMFAVTAPMFLGRAWLAMTGRIGTQLIGPHDDAAGWLAVGQIGFVLFRGFSLFVLEAERGQHRLAALVERDALTGAYNRTGFDRRRHDWSGDGAVLMIDLDLFKPLNDRCGHATGDTVLRIVAQVATAATGPRDMVVRWGGDEFVCILPGADSAAADAAAAIIATRFAAAIVDVAPDDLPVSLSIGSAHGSLGDVVALLGHADAAMYAVKRHRTHRMGSGNAALPILTGRTT